MALELQSIIHKEGSFDKQGISISIQQELIFIYKNLYDICMGFTHTHSTKHENRLLLPQIIYKDMHIHRNKIYYFLKKLINSEKEKSLINQLKQEQLERDILVKMQYLLIYYLTFQLSSSMIMRFFAFVLQPIIRIREHFQEQNLRNEIGRQFCISSKEECLMKLKEINNDIEDFLSQLKEDSYSITHPLLLLIHAAYIVQKKILEDKVTNLSL